MKKKKKKYRYYIEYAKITSIEKKPIKIPQIRMIIDSSFDFTTDTPGFWDGFWQKKDGLGIGGSDPDLYSPTLQKYHQVLWSRRLPNGEVMRLKTGFGPYYLTWKDHRFGSDSIVTSFRNSRCKELVREVSEVFPDYISFVEDYVHKAYTIGGSIIFPKHRNSINQQRGCNYLIGDRWDLTLECIRRFYKDEDSPLFNTLTADKPFFDLFVDFKGYVDFFYLQDCVADDYCSVRIWMGKGNFSESPYPQSIEQYLDWVRKQLDFVAMRNKRIDRASNRVYSE